MLSDDVFFLRTQGIIIYNDYNLDDWASFREN
jgi:hypothetical protein